MAMGITDAISSLTHAVISSFSVQPRAATGDISGFEVGISDLNQGLVDKEFVEFVVRIECRTCEGERHPENDLELELYRSGNDLNLILSWCEQPGRPMLWQGKHSVWMDCSSGERCQPPADVSPVESLARRIQSLFTSTL